MGLSDIIRDNFPGFNPVSPRFQLKKFIHVVTRLPSIGVIYNMALRAGNDENTDDEENTDKNTQMLPPRIVNYIRSTLRKLPGGVMKLSAAGISLRDMFPGFSHRKFGFK